jgi:L-ascorbate metabolism protein UlaG (beta-lactamase superfamily)
MSEEIRYRLADSTLVEPLVNNWVAWSYVISPAAASLHLLHYQLKTMHDYLLNPELHVRACANPELTGGPFINIPAERAGEVRELLARTERRQAASLEFARDITDFQNLLVAEAKGQSLEPFYAHLPETMRGYVELLYDYYSRPLVRFVEGLLYQSDYYNQGLQSFRISQLLSDDARAFFLSTPRLPQPGQIDWQVPFADPLVDELFKLDTSPQPLHEIRQLLGSSVSDEQSLLRLLMADESELPKRWSGSGVRLRYFGHACVLVEWNGVSILTDPFIAVTPLAGGIERLSFRDLPQEIDYVLITHNHSDHFVLETLLRLRHRIGSLVVPKSYGILYGDISLKLMAQKLGFKRVVELETMESIELPGGEIIAIPFFGEHGDLAHGKSAFVVRAGAEQIMFGADSDCLDHRVYENVRRSLGPIETVFLGTECIGAPLTWSYGPLFPVQPERSHVQSRRQHGCDSRAALEILKTVGARSFYNYGMGLEPWLEQILALGLSDDSPQIRESDAIMAQARERGLLAERPYGWREIHLEPETAPRPDRSHTARMSDEDGAAIHSRAVGPEDEDEAAALSRSTGALAANDAEDQFIF